MIACPSQKYRIKRNTKQCNVINVPDDKLLSKGQDGGKKNQLWHVKMSECLSTYQLKYEGGNLLVEKVFELPITLLYISLKHIFLHGHIDGMLFILLEYGWKIDFSFSTNNFTTFVGPSVCRCLAEYVGTHCGLEGKKTLWYVFLYDTPHYHLTALYWHRDQWCCISSLEGRSMKNKRDLTPTKIAFTQRGRQ